MGQLRGALHLGDIQMQKMVWHGNKSPLLLLFVMTLMVMILKFDISVFLYLTNHCFLHLNAGKMNAANQNRIQRQGLSDQIRHYLQNHS